MDGNTFLLQSRELLSEADKRTNYDEKEGYLRSAVSRAYYGLFHQAKSHLQSSCSKQYNEASKELTGTKNRDLEGEKVSEHRLVVDTLYSLDRVLSSQFKAVRNRRNDADYHFTMSFQYSDTTKTLDKIDTLLVEIKKLKG